MLTLETKASANADGSTVNTSCGLQENPTNGGSVQRHARRSPAREIQKRAPARSPARRRSAAPARAATSAPPASPPPSPSGRAPAGTVRTPPSRSASAASCASVEPADRVAGESTPRMMSNCETSIMPPIPQENPVTTACGTRAICRPRRITQNPIMITDATIETFAAPPTPWFCTASAMNGTVALAVPPISTGLRPSSAMIGRRQDRRENAQHRRQPHQRRHGQTVGQRDQCRDHAARDSRRASPPSRTRSRVLDFLRANSVKPSP